MTLMPALHTHSRRFIAGVLVMALLAGCGSTRLTNELKPYVGRDVHDLTTRLGNPTGERETTSEGGTPADRVYVWSTDTDSNLASTPFSPSPGGGGGMSYAGSESSGGVIHVKLECTIEVTVNAHNIVQRYEFEGSDAGCSRYRGMLGH